jgi:hypothetical protein
VSGPLQGIERDWSGKRYRRRGGPNFEHPWLLFTEAEVFLRPFLNRIDKGFIVAESLRVILIAGSNFFHVGQPSK